MITDDSLARLSNTLCFYYVSFLFTYYSEEILSSAAGITRKYSVNEPHTRFVHASCLYYDSLSRAVTSSPCTPVTLNHLLHRIYYTRGGFAIIGVVRKYCA